MIYDRRIDEQTNLEVVLMLSMSHMNLYVLHHPLSKSFYIQ